MDIKRQEQTPLLTTIKSYIDSKPIPFDVPGHKMGRLKNEFTDLVGEKVFQADVNAPLGIDNLYKGHGVIKQSSDLFADAYDADEAIFLINGTTSGIMTMIMGVVNAKEKIILPRNVHKSVINALIVSGAYPIFVQPDIDEELGIANGVPLDTYIAAMNQNPDAKAIFVINPTYFGVVSNLREIVKEAHKRDMVVLVDEAHGSHLQFNDNMPYSAMESGADVCALSMHKTGGSLTQSSVLLIKNDRVDYQRILRAYTMFGSTSPSHLLLASLDAARKKMVFEGKSLLDNCLKMADEARKRINNMKGLSCLDRSYCDSNSGRYDFDETKLVVRVNGLGLSGFEVYKILRYDYNIQLELAEVNLILAIISIGTLKSDVDALVDALEDISNRFYHEDNEKEIPVLEHGFPVMAARPREAYHAPYKSVRIEDAIGEISTESVMVYPPGIPLVIPGECISVEVVNLYQYYNQNGGVIMSDSLPGFVKIIDQENWKEDSYY